MFSYFFPSLNNFRILWSGPSAQSNLPSLENVYAKDTLFNRAMDGN